MPVNSYKPNKAIILLTDLLLIKISFFIAFSIKFRDLSKDERQARREVWYEVVIQQIVFITFCAMPVALSQNMRSVFHVLNPENMMGQPV